MENRRKDLVSFSRCFQMDIEREIAASVVPGDTNKLSMRRNRLDSTCSITLSNDPNDDCTEKSLVRTNEEQEGCQSIEKSLSTKSRSVCLVQDVVLFVTDFGREFGEVFSHFRSIIDVAPFVILSF